MRDGGREDNWGENDYNASPSSTDNPDWSLSAIKTNNNNKIGLSNVPPNAQPQQWLQQ